MFGFEKFHLLLYAFIQKNFKLFWLKKKDYEWEVFDSVEVTRFYLEESGIKSWYSHLTSVYELIVQ